MPLWGVPNVTTLLIASSAAVTVAAPARVAVVAAMAAMITVPRHHPVAGPSARQRSTMI